MKKLISNKNEKIEKEKRILTIIKCNGKAFDTH